MNLITDINNLKNKDKVLIEGKYETIKMISNRPCIEHPEYSWKTIEFDEFVEKIEEVLPYTPKIYYCGSNAVINSYVLKGKTLLYLNIAGQDQMVNSIISVLLQGKIKFKDHEVLSDKFQNFNINIQGNRKITENRGEGLTCAIMHHAPSISNDEANVLIGKTEEMILDSFLVWLDNSQPIPYPQEIVSQLFKVMLEKEYLIKLNTYNIIGYEINEEIKKDEYKLFREMIIDLCKKHNLFDTEQPYRRVLPQSSYLDTEQIEDIYNSLDKLPDAYALDGEGIKPVGMKLFCANKTVYIVESNKHDEWYDEFTRCFAYIRNESDTQFSEWGYVNVPELLTTEIQIPMRGTNRHIINGFEKDLFFEDMYITASGELLNKEEYQNAIK